MWFREGWLAVLAPALLAAGAAAGAAANAPSIDARASQAAAVQAAGEGEWGEALNDADAAVHSAPAWGEAYFTRAGICAQMDGDESKLASLQRPRTGAAYRTIGAHLQTAYDDLRKYLELEPKAHDREKVIAAMGELKRRIDAAQLAAAQQQALDDSAAKTRQGYVLTSDGHWCWPGQVWSAGTCEGTASWCPRGWSPDARAGCMVTPCTGGRVSLLVDPGTSERACCWAGQAWSEEKDKSAEGYDEPFLWKGCTGAPSCPAGTAVRPDLGLEDTCVGPPTIEYEADKYADKKCKRGGGGKSYLITAFSSDPETAQAERNADYAWHERLLQALMDRFRCRHSEDEKRAYCCQDDPTVASAPASSSSP